jgi:hypothetical protein
LFASFVIAKRGSLKYANDFTQAFATAKKQRHRERFLPSVMPLVFSELLLSLSIWTIFYHMKSRLATLILHKAEKITFSRVAVCRGFPNV